VAAVLGAEWKRSVTIRSRSLSILAAPRSFLRHQKAVPVPDSCRHAFQLLWARFVDRTRRPDVWRDDRLRPRRGDGMGGGQWRPRNKFVSACSYDCRRVPSRFTLAATSLIIGDAVPAVWGSGTKPSCYGKEAGICARPPQSFQWCRCTALLQRSSPSRGAT
jgi:hypothetical protein